MKRVAQIGVVVWGGIFLVLILSMVYLPHTFVRMDTAAATLLHPFQSYEWIDLFTIITTLGSTTGIILLALLTALFLQKRPDLIARLALVLVAESVAVQLIKAAVSRIRPPGLAWLGQAHSFSFPSGHSTSAMALFGFVAVLLFTRLTGYARVLAVSTCILLVLAIGLSRIVLAAHYFSDVIAGFALGGFLLSLVFLLPLSSVFKKLSVRH